MHVKIFAIAAICLLMTVSAMKSSATEEEPTTVSPNRVEFYLTYGKLELAFDTWDNAKPPDTVKLDAYKTASGFLSGVPFHFERNRDKVSVIEQVEAVPENLEYLGYSTESYGYRFNFAITVPRKTQTAAKTGTSIQGHGVSQIEERSEARNEARRLAFEDAIRRSFNIIYTANAKPIPGVVDGKINWYEITRDEVDPENGDYVIDIDAWVSIDESINESGNESDNK